MKILKKISKVIVIVMAVLATIWCGLYVYANYFYNDKQIDVENFYIAELPLTPSQFEEDFKEIHQIVMENYSLYQAKHLNMDSLYQACDARVRQAQTTTDYGLIVQEYISALQCAHAITCYKRYTANQRVAFIEDSLFVDKPSDYLTEYGFQDKDRIIAINGLPYKQWIEQNEKYTEASTVPHRRLRTAYDAFRSYADNIWNALYSGVSSANRVLYQFENSTIEMNGKENYIAELKVARAFYYYLLLEAFGNVPIIDRFDVPDGYLPATEPRSKVFEFVESELKNNINNLSEDVLNTYGRFNKWNAKMLLARLYLNAEAWIGTPMYNECENLCNEIIATNKYRLDGDYSLPFSTNNELSNETMFVIPFDETKSGGQIYMWARKTLHYSQMQTFNLQATWLDGGCVGVPTFFDNYIEGDKRLEKTWRMGQQYALDGTPLWTNGWCGDPQMLLSYTKDVTNISGDATMYQGYRFGKYEIKIGATGTPDNDYVIMRYAEVLMMKAECILRTGGSSQEAAELVNEVRRRNFDTTNELTGSELEATTICNGVPVKYGRFLQELGVEFALEGLRRSQLIRFDNNFTKGTWWEHQPTNDTKRNLMLIPFDQLQRNSNLVQNPK